MTTNPAPLLFEPADTSVESREARARQIIASLLGARHPICASWSAGKDSSVVLNLLLTTAAELQSQGVAVPPIIVTHADTGIENPEMTAYAQEEMRRVHQFAAQHRLEVAIKTAHPALNDTWAVRVLSGRALPSFPGNHRDCTTDWKIRPMRKLRKAALKSLTRPELGWAEPITLVGTRYDESVVRGAAMRSRGDSDIFLRRSEADGLLLTPIANWSADDVWEYLGNVRAGVATGYSDFDETFRVYADAMGSSCVIVGEDSSTPTSSKACGARHGCALCTVVQNDKSMENMLEQPRYAYMQGLNNLRNFLAATRWDLERRNWLGRTIRDGYLRLHPDTYSPQMTADLLRYSLTIDAEEREAARQAGIRPRFELVNIQQLFAIDAIWSLQALHPPYEALRIYRDVAIHGRRYEIPHVEPLAKPSPFPAILHWHVGHDWDQGERYTYTGLRDALSELAASDESGCMPNRTLPSGQEVIDVNRGPLFDIEVETAYFLLDELDELLDRTKGQPPTTAYMHYARLGLLTVKAGMEAEIDSILRRSNFKIRTGLQDNAAVIELYQQAAQAMKQHPSTADLFEPPANSESPTP